jgi:hypothetical protein
VDKDDFRGGSREGREMGVSFRHLAPRGEGFFLGYIEFLECLLETVRVSFMVEEVGLDGEQWEEERG